MNGRVYDPGMGRFLSVDPIIQSPGNSQSLNPYSYVMNNPLAGTDPTGYTSCGEGPEGCDAADLENIDKDQFVKAEVTADGKGQVTLKSGEKVDVTFKQGISKGSTTIQEGGSTFAESQNIGSSISRKNTKGSTSTADISSTTPVTDGASVSNKSWRDTITLALEKGADATIVIETLDDLYTKEEFRDNLEFIHNKFGKVTMTVTNGTTFASLRGDSSFSVTVSLYYDFEYYLSSNHLDERLAAAADSGNDWEWDKISRRMDQIEGRTFKHTMTRLIFHEIAHGAIKGQRTGNKGFLFDGYKSEDNNFIIPETNEFMKKYYKARIFRDGHDGKSVKPYKLRK